MGRLGIDVCHACNRSWTHRVPNLSNTSLEGAVCTFLMRTSLIMRTIWKQLLDDAEYVDPKLKFLVMEGILVKLRH